MEIKRNDPAALPRFAALNAQWIEDLHYLEESDKLMVAHPEIYIQNGNSVFSAHINGEVAMSSPKWRSIPNFAAMASDNI